MIFKLLAVAGLLPIAAFAQPVPEMGFVRIVNAVSPGTGHATFLIDGRSLFEGGYQLGQTTGGYGVARGTRTIEVRKAGVVSGSTRVDLAEGETMTVIAYAERLPAVRQEDKPRWTIKLLRLKQQDHERGFGLSIVPVTAADDAVVDVTMPGKGKTQKVHAGRLKITKVNLGRARDDVEIVSGGRNVATVSLDARGNYVVILFDDAGGGIGAISFYDPKFVVAG